MKILWRRFHFDSAHYLPDYEGRCHNLHGHRWTVDIGIEGNVCEEGTCKGMILDFSVLKVIVNPLFELLDHNCLNNILDNPTAENIIDYLVKEIKKVLTAWLKQTGGIHLRLVGLKVWETPEAYIEWRENS